MRILTSHVGYDAGEPKRAVMLAARPEPFSTAPLAFRLLDAASGARVFHGLNRLRERTVPAVLRWFRSQRCAGPWDEADRRAPFFGGRPDRVDVHGGWYDASGDYSKYLSHLSYANYLNPQHSPLAVWVFLACARLLADGPGGGPGGQTPGLKEELQAAARYGAGVLRGVP